MNLKIHLCLARLGRAQRAGDEAVASSSLSARSAWQAMKFTFFEVCLHLLLRPLWADSGLDK